MSMQRVNVTKRSLNLALYIADQIKSDLNKNLILHEISGRLTLKTGGYSGSHRLFLDSNFYCDIDFNKYQQIKLEAQVISEKAITSLLSSVDSDNFTSYFNYITSSWLDRDPAIILSNLLYVYGDDWHKIVVDAYVDLVNSKPTVPLAVSGGVKVVFLNCTPEFTMLEGIDNAKAIGETFVLFDSCLYKAVGKKAVQSVDKCISWIKTKSTPPNPSMIDFVSAKL